MPVYEVVAVTVETGVLNVPGAVIPPIGLTEITVLADAVCGATIDTIDRVETINARGIEKERLRRILPMKLERFIANPIAITLNSRPKPVTQDQSLDLNPGSKDR